MVQGYDENSLFARLGRIEDGVEALRREVRLDISQLDKRLITMEAWKFRRELEIARDEGRREAQVSYIKIIVTVAASSGGIASAVTLMFQTFG